MIGSLDFHWHHQDQSSSAEVKKEANFGEFGKISTLQKRFLNREVSRSCGVPQHWLVWETAPARPARWCYIPRAAPRAPSEPRSFQQLWRKTEKQTQLYMRWYALIPKIPRSWLTQDLRTFFLLEGDKRRASLHGVHDVRFYIKAQRLSSFGRLAVKYHLLLRHCSGHLKPERYPWTNFFFIIDLTYLSFCILLPCSSRTSTTCGNKSSLPLIIYS